MSDASLSPEAVAARIADFHQRNHLQVELVGSMIKIGAFSGDQAYLMNQDDALNLAAHLVHLCAPDPAHLEALFTAFRAG